MLRWSLIAASFLMVSSVAEAQTITTPPVEHLSGDVVVLKNGSVLHGAVREMTPSVALTIVLENGEIRTLAWNEIERVDIDRAKAASSAPVATRTVVHLEGMPDDAFVQMLDQHGAAGAWAEVCKAACDRELPTDGLYRVAGAGIRASQPFRIEGPRAELHVKTASSVGFAGGLALLIGGGVAFVNGISFILLGTVDQALFTTGTDRDFLIAGGVLTGVGVAALITGIFIMRGNARSSVMGATTVRVPAWQDAPVIQPSTRFGAITFPALSGSF
jgi:hypothetical protein